MYEAFNVSGTSISYIPYHNEMCKISVFYSFRYRGDILGLPGVSLDAVWSALALRVSLQWEHR